MAPPTGRGGQGGRGGFQAGTARRGSQQEVQGQGRRGSQATTEKPSRRASQVKWEDEVSDSSESSSSEEEDAVKDNILTVKVFEAKDLVAADRGGTSDPYVVVEFAGQSRKTKTIKQTINPKWNESFQFEIGRPSGMVTVKVFDYDMLNSHDFLGQVELNLANLSLEAVQEGWYDLQPRGSGNDVVSGQMHISTVIMPKNKAVEDTTGLDSYPWLNREEFLMPPPERTQNIIRIYLATTFVDFQDEVGQLHSTVFPRVQELCLTKGYTFSVVDMRWGLDEKQDKMYMHDPRYATLAFREIAECRRISPGANFFCLIGDRYGASPLPMSLDKNEFMAIRGKLTEDAEESEEAAELLGLLAQWYQLDENQVPNRFVLAKHVGEASPSGTPGTPPHHQWMSAEKKLFSALRTESAKLLSGVRLWKYKVSVFEQEMLLGALLPEDAADHAICFIRQVANLRVVNPNAAKFVDIVDRRANVLQDNYKEIRPNMVDDERRNRLADLKERTKAKLKDRCQTLLTQWLGWTIGSDHLIEFSAEAQRMLSEIAMREMEKHPRVGFLCREVRAHYSRQRKAWRRVASQPHHHRNQAYVHPDDIENPDQTSTTFDRVKQYLQSTSDGTMRPMVLRGSPGSGISGLCSLAVEWSRVNWPPGAVAVYREVGLTPDAANGTPLLFGVTKEVGIAYAAHKEQLLSLQLFVLQGAELPIADQNFFGSGGTSDPYVKVDVGTFSFKTNVQKKTLNPDWGEEESFFLDEVDADAVISVSVWDYDMLTRDDVLGRVEIRISSLELNKEYDQWFAVPLEPPPKEEKHTIDSLIIRIVAAKDIIPLSRRLSVDPYIKVVVAEAEEATEVARESMDPEWDTEFELHLPHGETKMYCELWDKNINAGEEQIVGSFEVEVGELGADRTIDDWFDVKLEPVGRIGSSASDGKTMGRVHMVITKKVVEEEDGNQEEEEEEEVVGPRLRLRFQVVPQKLDIEEELDKPSKIPCAYLDLCDAFQESISHASASKPLLVVIDGLNKLPSSDPVSSLRWLPNSLPRYTYIILGIQLDRSVETELVKTRSNPSGYLDVNSRLESRAPPPITVEVSNLEPDECRKKLNAALNLATPRRALTGDQRSVLLRSFNARSIPLVLQAAMDVAAVIPSFHKGGPIDTPSHALRELIQTRTEYPCRGRVDSDRVWKVLEYLAVTPFGVPEADLRVLLAGGAPTGKEPCPWACWSEVRLVLQPLLMELAVDGCILLTFRHDAYREVVLEECLGQYEDFKQGAKLVREMYEQRGDFDAGGQIDERKLRVLPGLLQSTGQDADYEDVLTDMHLVEMRLCCRQMFDLQRQLVRASPGQGGRVEDLVGFLEEFAKVLVDRPRMLLQLALNMPNHTGVYREGRVLDIRRRRGYFYAMHTKKGGAGQESAEDMYFRRQQMKAAGKGDTDLEILHEHAMEWRKAKPWLNWINKPQSRGQCKKTLRGHTSPTCAAQFVHGGMLIASGSADRSLRAWSPQTAEQLKELGEHRKAVTVMAVSPGEDVLVTGGEEGCVAIWSLGASTPDDALLGRTSSKWRQEIVFPSELRRFQAHSKRTTGIAFLSPTVIVVSSDDEEVKLFEVASGREVGSFVPFRFGVAAVACTPPGKIPLIAVAGQSKVKLVRGDNLDGRGGLYGHQRRVSDLRFSHIGDRIATCAWDGLLIVWDQMAAREWVQVCTLSGHTDAIRALCWSPDDCTIVTASVDKTIKIWKMMGSDEYNFQEVHSEDQSGSDVDETGKGDVTGEEEAEAPAITHKGRSYEFQATLTGHAEAITRVDFHPEGSLILSCSHDRDIRVWDVRVPRSEMGVAGHSQAIHVVTSGRVDGRQVVASAGADGFARVWAVSTAEQLKTIEHRHSAHVTALCISNSGLHLLTGSKDGVIKRWGLGGAPGSVASHPGEQAKAHRGGVACMDVLHVGEFFVSGGSQDGKVTVWDAETMLDVVSFAAPADVGVMHASFSSDGRFVISADTGGSVRVWSVEAGREVLGRSIVESEEAQLACVDFSPNGQFVASVAKKSAEIRVWDASSGLKLDGTLRGHSGPVFATSFAGEGKYLCSLGGADEFFVWEVASREHVATFLVDFRPTALHAGRGWPLAVVGDVKGNAYFLEFMQPQPVEPEEEEEATRRKARLRSRRRSTATKA